MNTVKKIISGGQTGVDQAALNAAITLKLKFGGWCPPGKVCEAGKIPDYYHLKETPEERSKDAPDVPRSLRTEWNVRDSDATLVFMPPDLEGDKGTDWTIQCAIKYKRKFLIVDPDAKDAVNIIVEWLMTNKIIVLNVAGPSKNTVKGIGEKVYEVLLRTFRTIENNK
jgi:Circularly permutated YpsA SLOG family